MKIIYFTSGPQGAGKTTLSKEITKRYPDVKYVSMDEHLLEVHWKLDINLSDILSDKSAFRSAEEKLFLATAKFLHESDNVQLIFDSYNIFPEDRKRIVELLRKIGADMVICWKFVTPIDTSFLWLLEREQHRKLGPLVVTMMKYSMDYVNYHQFSKRIAEDGFDSIHEIDMSSALSLKDILQ